MRPSGASATLLAPESKRCERALGEGFSWLPARCPAFVVALVLVRNGDPSPYGKIVFFVVALATIVGVEHRCAKLGVVSTMARDILEDHNEKDWNQDAKYD